jgi:hypothetical protein
MVVGSGDGGGLPLLPLLSLFVVVVVEVVLCVVEVVVVVEVRGVVIVGRGDGCLNWDEAYHT